MLATRCLRVAVKLERGVRIPFVNLEALRTYNEIYSNVNVPSTYVIGSKDDAAKWLEKDLGKKLGRHVATVRRSFRCNQIPSWSEEAKELSALGFIVDPYKESMARVLLAFKVYIEKFGNGEVKHNFRIGKLDGSWPEVTRGMKLGQILIQIRKSSYPTIKNKLREMGVTVDNVISTPNFERNFAALQVFKKIHGHVKVPYSFVIPDDDTNYAAEARGIKLGSWLAGVRRDNRFTEHRQRLIDLGVEFSVYSLSISAENIVETLNAFKSIYGHSNVHPSFVVPSGDSRFPEMMWGVNLVLRIKEMRLWRKLTNMGVLDISFTDGSTINFDALRAYKSLYGDLRIPRTFIIGSDSDKYKGEWPENLLGLSLGEHVRVIRSRLEFNVYPVEIVKELNELGFIDSVPEKDAKVLLVAFQTYIDKFGHGRVPKTFKIDKKDESWPEETRGIHLGNSLSSIRGGAYPSINEKLRTMGIAVDSINSSPDFERNFAAMQVFKKIHGHVKVPVSFVVRDDDTNYAAEARGIKLGKWLSSIRHENFFAQHKPRLVELGVSFEIAHAIPDEVMLSAMTSFKSVYGHSNVHPSFVVPSGDSRFPEMMWGVELGKKIGKWKVWKRLSEMGFTNLKTGPVPLEKE